MGLNDFSGEEPNKAVRITKEEFEDFLDEIFGDKWTENTEVNSGEFVYEYRRDINLPNETEEHYSNDTKHFIIRIYSSVDKVQKVSRDVGEDAIRVVVLEGEEQMPITKIKRTHRIKTWRKNLEKKIKKSVEIIKEVKTCPKCNNILVLRENRKSGNRFYGCRSYPECQYTQSYN